MRSYRLFLLLAALLAVAGPGLAHVRAGIVTQIVEFSTPAGNSQNQLTVAGKLNTLSQALGVVDFGNASVNVNGVLRAQLTMDISQQGDIDVLGFVLLGSNFTQSGVSLFYDVPNTTRRVTFSATDLEFGLQLNGQTNTNQQALTVASTMPSNAYQMMQSIGTAQVGVTNRPPVTQNLSQQSVLSTYLGNQPIGQASFAVLPPPIGSQVPLIELTVPLSQQQVHYAGVGLPVTLSYSGALSLVAPLTMVPEPGTLALVGGGLLMLTLKRPRIAFRGRCSEEQH